jgi:hypothetical protein
LVQLKAQVLDYVVAVSQDKRWLRTVTVAARHIRHIASAPDTFL